MPHDTDKVAEIYHKVPGAADSSIYISQDPRLTDWCLCTCCHEKNLWRSQCVIFKNSQYDLHYELVLNALSTRLVITNSKVYICKSCHKSLLIGKIPHKRPHQNEVIHQKCILCCSVCDKK